MHAGKSALYFRTSLPESADATIALTLNVFLLLGFPVDALKLPNVAMVTPSICTISWGNSYCSVTFSRIYFNSDLYFLHLFYDNPEALDQFSPFPSFLVLRLRLLLFSRRYDRTFACFSISSYDRQGLRFIQSFKSSRSMKIFLPLGL